MKHDPKFQPTPSELAILQILWSRGPSTVREIHAVLAQEKDVGYTSALKFLQIMTAKGLVTRTEDQRAHVYSANQPAEKTKQQFAADVLQARVPRFREPAHATRAVGPAQLEERNRRDAPHARRIRKETPMIATTEFMQTLAWSLLHFLWQGAAIAARRRRAACSCCASRRRDT